MATVRATTEVSAQVKDVFGFVTLEPNYRRYIPAYASGTILAGEDGQVGMKLRWRTRMAGVAVPAEETLFERVDGERVRYRGSMLGVPFESCMETSATAAGTRFAVTVEYHLPVPLVGPSLDAAVRPLVQREVDQTVARVREIFQGDTAGPRAAPDGEARSPEERAHAGQPERSRGPLDRRGASGGHQLGGRGAELDAVRKVYARWGRHPALYAAQDWVTFLGKHRLLRRRAVEAMGVGPGARVLEVACGTGRNLANLQRLVGPTGTVVGFDYSPEMLDAARDLARRRGWDNVQFVQGDAAVLEVEGAPFDGIVSVLGMSAVPDHLRALQRCRALLRPGGRLVVCDARRFEGRWAALNPLVEAVYRRGAAWNPERDLVGDLRRVFGEVTEETFLGGAYFIAVARRPE